MLRIGLLVLVLVSCKTTTQNSEAQSRNGDVVRSGYESVALITATYGDGTGVMISPRLMLTVNHVIEGEERRVRTHPNFAHNRPTQAMRADAVRILDTDPRQELALVKLSRRVNGPYAKLSSTAASTSDLTTVGYGINTGTSTPRQAKLKASVQLRGYRGVSENLGAPSMPTAGNGRKLMGELVPGSRDQLPCSGDSGGPVFQDFQGDDVVLGVMSHIGETDGTPSDVFDYCRKALTARYVPVHLYRTWLDEQAAELGERITWVDLGGQAEPGEPEPVEPEEPIEPDEPVNPPVVEPAGDELGNGWFVTRETVRCERVLAAFYRSGHYYRNVLADKQCQLLVGHRDGNVGVIAKYQRTEIPLRGLTRLSTTKERSCRCW